MSVDDDVREALKTIAQFGDPPFFRVRDIAKICREVGLSYSDDEVTAALDRSPSVVPGYMEWYFAGDAAESRVRIYRLKA